MSTSLSENGTRGYAAIAAALRHEIVRGAHPAGAQLPAIGELARRYGATAITARRALRQLEEEGLIRVEHGVGTFVADWSRQHDLFAGAGTLPSFGEEAVDAGSRTTEVLHRDEAVPHAPAARALGLDVESPLAVLERLRRVNGRAVAFQRSYLPSELATLVRDYTPDASLYRLLLARTGRAPHTAEERLLPVVFPSEVAARLEVAEGALGWQALRTTFDVANVPLLYDDAYFPADRVELRTRLHAGQTLLTREITTGSGPDPVSTP
jgi:GntR family transcriptional regulator